MQRAGELISLWRSPEVQRLPCETRLDSSPAEEEKQSSHQSPTFASPRSESCKKADDVPEEEDTLPFRRRKEMVARAPEYPHFSEPALMKATKICIRPSKKGTLDAAKNCAQQEVFFVESEEEKGRAAPNDIEFKVEDSLALRVSSSPEQDSQPEASARCRRSKKRREEEAESNTRRHRRLAKRKSNTPLEEEPVTLSVAERRKKKTAGKSNSQGTTAPVEGPESDTGDRIRENIRSCLATKLQSEVGSVERARALG